MFFQAYSTVFFALLRSSHRVEEADRRKKDEKSGMENEGFGVVANGCACSYTTVKYLQYTYTWRL